MGTEIMGQSDCLYLEDQSTCSTSMEAQDARKAGSLDSGSSGRSHSGGEEQCMYSFSTSSI